MLRIWWVFKQNRLDALRGSLDHVLEHDKLPLNPEDQHQNYRQNYHKQAANYYDVDEPIWLELLSQTL